MAALMPAANISESFSTNARFEMKSPACAMNIRRPVGTMISSAPRAHGSRCRDSNRTGICRERPSRRRSSIAIEPTSTTKPQMCRISTAG
ncbi:hypothetical protein D3C83_25130 [compost metagenome]